MAAATLDHHVAVLFKNDIGRLVKVEDRYARQFGGGATRFGHIWLHQMDQRLHDGMVSRVHVRVERERALPVTVERLVSVRGDDPILPVEVSKAHSQHSLLATCSKYVYLVSIL